MFNFTLDFKLGFKPLYQFVFFFTVMQNFAFAQGLDPTKPLSGSPQASKMIKKNQRLQLETVIHNANADIVIINGIKLTLNEYINEYQLVAINEKSVVLRSPLKQLELSIFTPVIMK